MAAHLILFFVKRRRAKTASRPPTKTCLKNTAGSAVNDVLTQQYAKVKAGHDRVRDLRDAMKDS